MSKAEPTFYLLHGDDDLRIEEETERLRQQFSDSPNAGLNTTVFDGTQAEIGDILGAALAFPFLADTRLVIVKDLLAHLTRKGAGNVGKKALESLADQLAQLPDWARLILVERRKIDERNKIVQLARGSDGGKELLYTVPKDTTGWILQRAQNTYQAQIEQRAAAALASVTQADLRAADNELLKLILYVDGTRPVTEADVALLTPYVAETSMFAMVDAIAEGRTQVAIASIQRLLEQQEDPFSIFGMIARQFRLLLLAKEYLVGGGYPKDLASVLGIHPYPAEKVARQSRSFSLEQLETIYRSVQDYDLRIKTGRIDALLALELLVAGLTA
ncbi:MAG: DNA polymerase III subunit delta [Anaerolineae bacterium]|nr:DNA polymerase III subunit delta [Anaerolineae bacterium]